MSDILSAMAAPSALTGKYQLAQKAMMFAGGSLITMMIEERLHQSEVNLIVQWMLLSEQLRITLPNDDDFDAVWKHIENALDKRGQYRRRSVF
jgi:hypothetical protein